MSKNLEREYRALVDSEAPDLWSRIEAGLEEKSAPDRSDPSKRIPFKAWAGLAAACVCVALIVPAVASNMRMGRSGSGDTAYDHAAPQAAEAGQREAYGNGAAEAAAENGGNANSAVTSGSMYATADPDTDNANDLAAEAAEEEPDVYCFDATVEILDTDVRRNSGILYTAKVIATDYPGIAVGSEITIFCRPDAAEGVAVLENEQTYDLTLREGDSDDAETEYELLGVQ